MDTFKVKIKSKVKGKSPKRLKIVYEKSGLCLKCHKKQNTVIIKPYPSCLFKQIHFSLLFLLIFYQNLMKNILNIVNLAPTRRPNKREQLEGDVRDDQVVLQQVSDMSGYEKSIL